jgi:NADH-quinone oxidoreductase subunit J
MSTVLIIFCVLAAVTLATAFLTILVETYSQCYLFSDLFFSIAGHYCC